MGEEKLENGETRVSGKADENSDAGQGGKRGIIVYEGKRYHFNPWSILIFAVAVPVGVVILYELLEYALWIRVMVADHTIVSLNFISGMGATVTYGGYNTYGELFNAIGLGKFFFSHVDDVVITFNIPGQFSIQFVTFCTGFQAIIIFAMIILFTPHSLDKSARKGIWKRKLLTLLWSSAIFYGVNIIRMWIQLFLYYKGFEWDDIHYSISAGSSFIAVLIVILMHKSLPEFVLSIVWSGIKIKEKFFPDLGYKKPSTK
ncbi:MAG: archaeosortase H [Promethearchaeota archaeon]